MKSFSKKSNNGLPVDTVAEGFDWPLCTATFDQIYQRDLLAHSQSATLQRPSIPRMFGTYWEFCGENRTVGAGAC